MILFFSTILFLSLAFFVQLRLPRKHFFLSRVFAASAVFVFLLYLFLVVAQYFIWREAGPPASYLVPPHRSIGYVFSYHFSRFLFWYLISGAVSLVFIFSALFLNAKGEARFFEREEPYLGALALFLLGNSAWGYAWIYYIFLLGAVVVVGSFTWERVLRREERFSLYYLWIPIALGVIIVMEVLRLL